MVWVLYLVMPGTLPDIPVSRPMLTLEECVAAEAAYPEAPFTLMCSPQWIDWGGLA
jgi:hypothetical protein